MFNASKGTTGQATDTANAMEQGAQKGVNNIQQSLGL